MTARNTITLTPGEVMLVRIIASLRAGEDWGFLPLDLLRVGTRVVVMSNFFGEVRGYWTERVWAMAFLDHNGECEFPLSKDLVYRALCHAIPSIQGMTVENADPLLGRIVVKAGVSMFSWGENIPIQLQEIGPNKTKVQITSTPKTGVMFGGAFDMGKNSKNIEDILAATSRVLQQAREKDQEETHRLAGAGQPPRPAPHSMSMIYVSRGGQQYGPYTTEQLRDYIAQGSITTSDLACIDGQNWVTVGQVLWDGDRICYEETYKDGKLMSAEVWKPNGEKCPVTKLIDGNGVVLWYKKDGTEELRQTYKDGEKVY